MTAHVLTTGDRVRFRNRFHASAMQFDSADGGVTLEVMRRHPIMQTCYLLRGPDGYEAWVASGLVWKVR